MKFNPTILNDEFIGTTATVVDSTNTFDIGLTGKVIDETQNTFMILTQGRRKRIIKNSSLLTFEFSDGSIIEINGKLVVGRSENRIKKRIRRFW